METKKKAAVLSPSKKIGFGVLFVGLMTIVVTAISKNNAGNRTSATGLTMYGSGCCVPATGTFSSNGVGPTLGDWIENFIPNANERCWQAYEGDPSDNKPLNQYCWTISSFWQGCTPQGSWLRVMDEVAAGNCGDPCQQLENACSN